MSHLISEPRLADGLAALSLLEKALQILDVIDAPSQIGAHVDLAICELRDALQVSRQT